MYCNLFDSHTHSENSPDGCDPVTLMAETAVGRGLVGIAVTDHCDIDSFIKNHYAARVMHSEISVAMAKEAFDGKLVISFGIELGQVFYGLDEVESLLKKHRFDFVLGSLHTLEYDQFDFYGADYKAMTTEKLGIYVEKYFEELLKLVNWGKTDVLAHMDYPWRYFMLRGVDVDLTRYREHIDEILKKAVLKGVGLEINVSSLRHGGDTMPPKWVIARYRELGGEIVTIGSDAHGADGVGDGINDGMAILENIGFSYFAFFRKRKPVMLKII